MLGLEIPIARDAELVEAYRAEGTLVPFVQVSPELQKALGYNYDKTGAGLRLNYVNLSRAISEIGLKDTVLLKFGSKEPEESVELDPEGVSSKVSIAVDSQEIEYPHKVDFINEKTYLGLIAANAGLSKEIQARRKELLDKAAYRESDFLGKITGFGKFIGSALLSADLLFTEFHLFGGILTTNIPSWIASGGVAVGSGIAIKSASALYAKRVTKLESRANYLTSSGSKDDKDNIELARRLALESPVLETTFTPQRKQLGVLEPA